MKEYWINPIAWSHRTVDQLLAKGWTTFQLDLEGGFFSGENIGWIVDSVLAKGARIVARVPADDLGRVHRLAKAGVRRFLVPGFDSVDDLAHFSKVARAAAADVQLVPMIESRAAIASIDAIAQVEGVSGVHFGLYDLCKERRITNWRDVSQLPAEILDHAQTLASRGLTAGTYMLPQWRGTHWPRHFDVLSYSLPEFAEPEVAQLDSQQKMVET